MKKLKKFINYYVKKKQGSDNSSKDSIDDYYFSVAVDENTNAIGYRAINTNMIINSFSPPSNIQVIVMLEKLKFQFIKNLAEDLQDEKFNLTVLPEEKERVNLWYDFYNKFYDLEKEKEEENNGN